MAKARSKKKAKSGSKAKKSAARKPAKKSAIKAKAKTSAKKAAPKKTAPKKKAVAKKAVAKKAPVKKVVARATAPRPPAPKATPAPAKKPLPPEVDRAFAQADVEGLINRLPPPVQPVVKTLRKLVLEAAPEASELLDDGAPAYFANGVFARIVPSERSVLVKFLRGGALPSASELEGEADGESRTISLSSVEELKENVLRKIVREAVMLNLSTPITVQA